MNTITKTILGVTVDATVGAILGISLDSEQRSFLLLRIKAGAKDLIPDFSSMIATGNVGLLESSNKTSPRSGEMTSELIDVDQYETYSF